jgi:hypothetical protein
MKNAFVAIGWIAFIIGGFITILTLIFAFSIGIRIVGVLVAVFGVGGFLCYVVWSWWTECVVQPMRKKRKPR